MKYSANPFLTAMLLLLLSACSQASATAIPAPSVTSSSQVSPSSLPTQMTILSATPTLASISEPSLVSAKLELPVGASAWQFSNTNIRGIDYSPDGRYLVIVGQEITIYQADALELWAKMPESQDMRSVDWSPNGKYLAGGSSSGEVSIWDTVTKEVFTSFKIDSWGIDSLAWSPDGQLLAVEALAVGGADVTLHVWNVVSKEESVKLDIGSNNHYSAIAWSLDGAQLAGGHSQSDWVTLWNIATGEKQTSLSGLPDIIAWVNSLAWSPDGKWLASGLGSANQGQSLVVIYDPVTGEKQHILAVSTDPEQIRGVETDPGVYHAPWDVDAVAWSPDSRLLASGLYNGMFYLWDISTGKVLASLGNIGAGKSATWSPDGKTLAIGTYEGILILWDVSQFLEQGS